MLALSVIELDADTSSIAGENLTWLDSNGNEVDRAIISASKH